MHAILEYLAIGVLIVLFLLVAFEVVDLVTGRLVLVKEEQLYNVAERVMDKILLTPGDPPDWGTNPNGTLTDFGLALNGTRTPYVVDPDKVMRLANLSTFPNPLLINSTEIASMLGLSEKYGFRLVMRPLLSVNVTPLELYNVSSGSATPIPSVIRVEVYNWYNFGVPGANVTAILVLAKAVTTPGGGTNVSYVLFAKNNVTDALGYTEMNFTREIDSASSSLGTTLLFHLYIIHVDWKGFVAVSGFSLPPSTEAPTTGYIIGKYVIINSSVNVGNFSGAIITKDEVVQALPEYKSLLTSTSITWYNTSPINFTVPLPASEFKIGYINYLEKLSSHVFILGKWNGSLIVIVINRIPRIDITYGARGSMPANSIVITRIAQIYNYPYLVRLIIWRKVEG